MIFELDIEEQVEFDNKRNWQREILAKRIA